MDSSRPRCLSMLCCPNTRYRMCRTVQPGLPWWCLHRYYRCLFRQSIYCFVLIHLVHSHFGNSCHGNRMMYSRNSCLNLCHYKYRILVARCRLLLPKRRFHRISSYRLGRRMCRRLPIHSRDDNWCRDSCRLHLRYLYSWQTRPVRCRQNCRLSLWF